MTWIMPFGTGNLYRGIWAMPRCRPFHSSFAVPFHQIVFDYIYRWLTRDTSAERVAFFWRVVCYVVWLAPILIVNVIADYAKTRAVVEDRRSMIGALVASVKRCRASRIGC